MPRQVDFDIDGALKRIKESGQFSKIRTKKRGKSRSRAKNVGSGSQTAIAERMPTSMEFESNESAANMDRQPVIKPS